MRAVFFFFSLRWKYLAARNQIAKLSEVILNQQWQPTSFSPSFEILQQAEDTIFRFLFIVLLREEFLHRKKELQKG